MDFARKQLEKYGWTDGKGLGRYENGISTALKPKLKRSVAGIGHDAAADFTEHWWTQLYNKAASNVEVENKNGKTKNIKTKDQEEFEITNNIWKMKKKKKDKKESSEQYADFFVKKATLTNGGSKVENMSNSDSDDEVDNVGVSKMTDEELFAACGGRTAHKGARHGLKATGKLARIAQQEQLLLKQPQYEGYSHTKNISKQNESNEVERKHVNSEGYNVNNKNKSKKKTKHFVNNDEKAECNISLPNDSVKEDNIAIDNVESIDSNIELTEDVSETQIKEKKNRKIKLKSANVTEIEEVDDKNSLKSKKRKKNKCL